MADVQSLVEETLRARVEALHRPVDTEVRHGVHWEARTPATVATVRGRDRSGRSDMTEASNSAGVRMGGIDPADVLAELDDIGLIVEAVEVIRAALEQVWYEGEAAGLRRADYEYGAATFQAVRANPYRTEAIRGESE